MVGGIQRSFKFPCSCSILLINIHRSISITSIFFKKKIHFRCMKRFMLSSLNFCRYKRLLCSVDLSKDFFFSYSYNIMRSLQKNITEKNTGQVVYETMCVWNEFLTRAIRNHLKNTCWTVALVHGFFKQVYSSAVTKLKVLLLVC